MAVGFGVCGMTTQIAVVEKQDSNIHTLDISKPTVLTSDERAALVEDLRVAVGTYRRSTIELGRILTALRDGTPHGEWEVFLKAICHDVKISRSSAHNFMNAYAETQFIPQELKTACDSASLSLEKPSSRSAV